MSHPEQTVSTGLGVTARRPRRMDRTDRAWRGRDTVRVLDGLDTPAAQQIRTALQISLEQPDHPLRRVVDHQEGLVSTVDDQAIDEWVDQMVVVGKGSAPAADAMLQRGPSLGKLPARYVVGEGWCAVQSAHAVTDGWSSLTALEHIFAQARATSRLDEPWWLVSSGRRDLMTARAIAQRPRAILAAIRNREELSGGPYEPAAIRSADLEHRTLSSTARSGFLNGLRRLRDDRWPAASLASLILVGLRDSLGRRLVPPREGAEIVYNARDLIPGAERAFGNWSAGLYVTPDDDRSPCSVTDSVAAVRALGLPVLATAATRVPRRRKAAPGLVAAPSGRPRLALSHINAHGPGKSLPWQAAGQSRVDQSTVPNGAETITISSCELGGRLHVSLSFYPATWGEAGVAQSLHQFLDDPASCLPRRRVDEMMP